MRLHFILLGEKFEVGFSEGLTGGNRETKHTS